jgi:hypothetical protein
MCFILLLLFYVPRTGKHVFQASMFFRQWSNIFLADQDKWQRCFFADQKQFPADHGSAVISSPALMSLVGLLYVFLLRAYTIPALLASP